MTEDKAALLQEFASRKAQVLNLEVRQFALVLALEVLFIGVFVFSLERVRQRTEVSLGAASVYFVLFFELLATNAKMGLVSVYLRQLERYMAQVGYVGVVWESKALDSIIFRPGNAFLLAAGLTVLLLVAQTVFVIHLQTTHFTTSATVRGFVTAALSIMLLVLLFKSVSVDFRKPAPNVFESESWMRET